MGGNYVSPTGVRSPLVRSSHTSNSSLDYERTPFPLPPSVCYGSSVVPPSELGDPFVGCQSFRATPQQAEDSALHYHPTSSSPSYRIAQRQVLLGPLWPAVDPPVFVRARSSSVTKTVAPLLVPRSVAPLFSASRTTGVERSSPGLRPAAFGNRFAVYWVVLRCLLAHHRDS